MTGRSFDIRRTALRAVATLTALSILATVAPRLRADVVPTGDITPSKADPNNTGQQIPDLPQFGGTSTGQLVIDIPSDTDPLISTEGIIGNNIFGLGLVTVVELNSEWSTKEQMVVGSEGQGILQIQAGARVVSIDQVATPNQNPAEDNGYDLWFGRFEGSQGFGQVDGFASLLLNNNTSIGHRGFGRVDVTNGGRFVTRSRASIGTVYEQGDNALGDGYVLVDGQASRWTIGLTATSAGGPEPDNVKGRLFVGREGRGVLEIRNQGIVRVEQDTFVGGGFGVSGDLTQAYGQIMLDGANSQLQNLGSLYVGDLAGETGGEVTVGTQALVRADGIDSIGGFSGTQVGPRGFINMAGGTVVTPALENNGVLRGSGTISISGTGADNLVTNNGDIRNAASLANQREKLLFRGVVNNTPTGIIESVGGEMEFQDTVNNDGLIFGKDAIFRFKADTIPLTGAGNMTLDNTIVESLLGVPLPVQALTLGDSRSQILGSIDLDNLDVTLGNTFSQLFVTGDAMIDGTLDISLNSGYTPQIGDSFEILRAANRTGVFSSIVGAAGPGGTWNVAYTPTSVFLNFSTIPGPVFASDFNGDGIVDGTDLGIWQTHLGMMPATAADGDANGDGKVDGADFVIWQQQNGSHFPVVPAAGAVPEPGALVLALTALAAFRRKRES
jgi:T5SS/PEP-CTERM-associated repeat protein